MFTAKSNIAWQGKKRKHEILGVVIRVNGRTVGQVIGDDYVKDITNRHMLATPPAIASDIQALHDAERAGAALLCLHEYGHGYYLPRGYLENMGHGNPLQSRLG